MPSTTNEVPKIRRCYNARRSVPGTARPLNFNDGFFDEFAADVICALHISTVHERCMHHVASRRANIPSVEVKVQIPFGL